MKSWCRWQPFLTTSMPVLVYPCNQSQLGTAVGDTDWLAIASSFLDVVTEISPNGLSAFHSNAPLVPRRKRGLPSECDRSFWLEPGTVLDGGFSGRTGYVGLRFKQDPFSVLTQNPANARVSAMCLRRVEQPQRCLLTGCWSDILQCGHWREASDSVWGGICTDSPYLRTSTQIAGGVQESQR